ncbi:SDR family oxidoreductase [Oligoflexia bacterium]|nr:SDR family oxidoreductase [Oligoflexia bacterium]
MDLGLKNKRAVVLASSDGLGKAVACELANEGVHVIISSRNEQNLKSALCEVGAHSYIQTDLSEPGAAAELIKTVRERLGGIDILITNAGGPPPGTFSDIDVQQWLRSFQELFLSVSDAVRESVASMSENNWGRIVMITSIAGKEPVPNLTISNALRSGVHGLMNTLSKELGACGITVNAVLPTYTDTARLRQLKRDTQELAAKIPVGRLGRPEEFAKLVTFLCSEHAGFISGQAVGFDGGSMHGL